MADRKLDVLFVAPGSSPIYQGLRGRYSAIEPPTWALLLAQSVRSVYGAAILDCDAEGLDGQKAVEKIWEYDPRLVVFVVMGSEPNQSTVRMASAVPLAKRLKDWYPTYKIAFVGNHVSALPRETLEKHPCIDFVLPGDGVYALRNLLATDFDRLGKNARELESIRGLVWQAGRGAERWLCVNDPERVVPHEAMGQDLPGYAWDLVDLSKYRSHFWHAGYDHTKRSPFAAIYTSLGCPFKCSFCMINTVNRSDYRDGVTAADSNFMRWWPAKDVFWEIDTLLYMDVNNIRISDEMFLLNKKHYEPILDGLIERNRKDSLNLWCYARVDTVRPQVLEKLRKAGIRWICLGIESGDTTVRREVAKGSYEEVDVRRVVKEVEAAGIEVIANYIVGLPSDTLASMQSTLDLACELNTSMFNVYPAMALPGSPLYEQAKREGKLKNDSYESFGFLSYECQPLGTDYLTPAEVVAFRDEAFHHYWGRGEFQSKIFTHFRCPEAVQNIQEMLKVRLKRKLLGDPSPSQSQ